MIATLTQPTRVYADTSVYGRVFDDQFAEPSRAFFARVRAGRFHLVTAALVEDELVQAPPEVRDWFGQCRTWAVLAAVTGEALALRQAYWDAGIVTQKALNDALHVAIATVARCNLIVSWNFRHIVNYQKVPLYNAVNALHRYAALDIRSPLEVIEDEE